MQSPLSSPLQLETLPSLPLAQRDRLPVCPAIYFALDSKERVLYVGKANNLLARWKDHHRLDHLTRIHKRSPVRLAWLDCSKQVAQLDAIEAHCIALYKPLLNGTPVPAKKITPAEVALQNTLVKIAKYIIVFGIAPASELHPLPTVNLRYLGFGNAVNPIRRILKASNKKPTGLTWTEFIRRKHGSWWRTCCNGIAITLGPWITFGEETEQLMQNANVQRLAGIELLALFPYQLQELIDKKPFVAEDYPGITALEADPIRLIWASSQQESLVPEQIIPLTALPSNSSDSSNSEMNEQTSLNNAPVASQDCDNFSIRKMDRIFLKIEGIEVEVCKDIRTQKLYIRHHLYWKLRYDMRNPDIERNRVREELKNAVNQRLPTIRWVGYDFPTERVFFAEDGIEIDVVLMPLAMFENLMRYWNHFHKQTSTQTETDLMKLGQWLEHNSIAQLLPK